jgi:hypothetical protein
VSEETAHTIAVVWLALWTVVFTVAGLHGFIKNDLRERN